MVCLGLVLGAGSIGISQMTALNLALLLTAAWWLLTTLPLLKSYKQLYYVEVEKHAVRQSFARIGHTLRHLPEDKQRSEERRVGKECRSRWSPYQ